MKLNRSTFKVWLLVTLAAVGSFSASAQTNKTGTKDFSDFKLITDRNIFDPNRRPPVQLQTRAPVVIVDTFALTGTMRYENGPFAVFDGNNSDYHKILGPGGRIATYTIGEIGNDSVKLTSGTNEVELKVGMQMQRGQDGKWSAGEHRGDTLYSYNGGNSRRYSSNNNNNNGGGRNDRFDRSSRNERRNFGQNSGYRNNGNGNRTGGNDFGNGQTEGNGGTETTADTAAPGDPTDPVARMMMRRRAEMGGEVSNDANQNDNGGNDNNQGNQGNQGDMPNGNFNSTQPGNDNQNPPDQNQNQPNNGEGPTRNENVPNGGAANGPQNPN